MVLRQIRAWLDDLFRRKDGLQDYCSCSPDVLFGVDIGLCCKYHDINYWGNEKLTGEEVDLIFREQIYSTFIQAGKKVRGWIVSRVYYFAVSKARAWENKLNGKS